jgi:hypothetical protein
VFILKTLSFIIVYIIKQRLFKEQIKIQHIVYILILTLWTRPILQQSLERQELAPFLDKIVDYVMMLFIAIV